MGFRRRFPIGHGPVKAKGLKEQNWYNVMTRAEKTEYLRTLYNYACGYCGATEVQERTLLTRDHFKPLTKGGRNSVDNMVYACAGCNRAKGDYFSESPQERFLHPKRDDLAEHLWLDPDGVYHALTPLGEVYVRVLGLNRSSTTT